MCHSVQELRHTSDALASGLIGDNHELAALFFPEFAKNLDGTDTPRMREATAAALADAALPPKDRRAAAAARSLGTRVLPGARPAGAGPGAAQRAVCL
jgi:hypothetical protein